jgi:type IV secretion system protein VirB5
MTGGRGMEGLLSGTSRNYLPSNWTQVTSASLGRGAPGYAGLSADVQSAIAANAVLSPQLLATLSPADQRQIQAARQWSAMQQALTHEALANASARFASIQSLIAAISTAADQKAILDLQARISAELGMLQNEQTKNQVLYQATQAQEAAMRQQAREQVVAEQGRFETRFQPVP